MKISERGLTIAGIIASVAMSSLALGFTAWAYYNPKPVPHTPNMPLPLFSASKENISWTNLTYPEIYNGKIPVANYAGITGMTVFFYFTAPSGFNQTVYARLCIDIQQYPCPPLYPLTTFIPGTTLSYSTSISIPLNRVTFVVADEFLSFYRCSVVLTDVVVNATLFSG